MKTMIGIGAVRQGRKAIAVGAVFALGALVLSGCGSSHNTIASTEMDPQAETTNARTKLGTLLAATPDALTGTTTLSSLLNLDKTQLQTIRSEFADAHAGAPTNTQAAFGFGATDLMVSLQEVANALPGGSDALTTLLDSAYFENDRSVHTLTAGRAAIVALANIPAARLRSAVQRAAATAIPTPTLTTALNDLLAALNRDLPLITQAANDPTFSFPLTGSGTTTTTVVDQADARGFEASLYGVRAGVDIALAYNLDSGSYDQGQALTVAFPQIAAGQAVTPSQYLPAAPFGQLQSNGAALFTSARSDLGSAVTTTQALIPLLQARTGTATYLIPSADITSDQYSTLQVELIAAQYALNHSFTTGSVTYNLPAWFANPPASLATLEPTYHFDGTTFRAVATDYPDRTFGGLVTGLPDYAFQVNIPETGGTVGTLAAGGFGVPLETLFSDDFSGQ